MRTSPLFDANRGQAAWPAVRLAAASLLAVAILSPFAAQPAAAQAAPAATVAPDPVVATADRGRMLGSEKATVWMLVVSDFQCPYCKQWHDQVWETLKRDYVNTGKIRVAYLNYPLGQHQNARPTAVASMCAAAQGKFWPVADALFASQKKWESLKDPAAAIDDALKSAHVDLAQAHECMSGKAMASLVEADHTRMGRLGINSTPTFFIGKTRIEGVQPIADFRKAIDAELAAGGGKSR